jgi:methionine-rich copper-binding protein CopC
MHFTAVRKLYRNGFHYAFLVLALLSAAVLAFAHAEPVKMTPAANSTVSAPPNVTIKFSEALEPKLSSVTVKDAAGSVVSKDQSVSADKLTVTVATPALTPGVYTVTWISVADDGHRAQGNYKFTVK